MTDLDPHHPTYAGALSFLRCPSVAGPDDLDRADVVVTGIPFDQATSGRPGARLGPRAVRAASVWLAELPGFPLGFDPLAELSVVDAGDCPLDYAFPTRAPDAIEAHAKAILDHDTTLISIGGDHFVTYPLLRAHAAKYGPLCLVHFDAHSDTWGDDGERLDHGSMFLRAAREGIVDPSRSVQIGIRTPNSSDHGFTILTAPWVHRHGVEAAIAVVRDTVGDHPTYVTFDIDCLDPAYAPGTGTPVAGGLTSAEGLDAVRSLTGLNLVGFDVMEVAPAYDHAEITAIAAATIAHDYLGLIARQNGAVPVPYGAAP